MGSNFSRLNRFIDTKSYTIISSAILYISLIFSIIMVCIYNIAFTIYRRKPIIIHNTIPIKIFGIGCSRHIITINIITACVAWERIITPII